ncbi:S-adenosyl-L-methionine-dependent methyltransferases superfamily protein [Actinidia rufa]|uniref:S-adenosyl-L-methionine-dependent methyltransferases superfamily protein n=1 Tax=Actinidia rufa TaxID=165716 RepID=A0A7J0DCD8_9ERIC|nr:S-adenosyl-L-methionine-dependent methyltransferases superfamily protein [Actinidia rufa]
MESHIKILPNSLSFASITIATVTLLFLKTPENCVPKTSNPKPHHKFPKSTCDFSHRSLTSIHKKNKKLWSSKDWLNKVSFFSSLFHDLQTLNHLNNRSRVLCVSAGAGHEVMEMKQIGLKDVSGVEVVESPPLVSRADPHNLPFFDGVFDLGFSAQFDRALFPRRYAAEMERTVRAGGACVVAVEACGDAEVQEVASLFRKSRFVMADSVTLTGT